MYPWTLWKDQVDQYEDRFRETQNADGTISHAKVRGTTQQVGTAQDAGHFNNMENGILSAHIAIGLIQQALMQQRLVVESGQVTLSNTLAYPFNNSKKTIPLLKVSDTTTYAVICDVLSSSGAVESIVVSDRLVNGFKLEFTGGAKSAVIRYTVIGGYLA